MKTAKEFLFEHWYFKNNFENPANKLLIKDVIDMMERYAQQFKISSNPVLADSLPTSNYPDTEADGLVWCGKCGKLKEF